MKNIHLYSMTPFSTKYSITIKVNDHDHVRNLVDLNSKHRYELNLKSKVKNEFTIVSMMKNNKVNVCFFLLSSKENTIERVLWELLVEHVRNDRIFITEMNNAREHIPGRENILYFYYTKIQDEKKKNRK